MRDLLASLPAPGPMPDDLERRITAALQDEQQKRAGEHDNVTPLVGRSTEQDQPTSTSEKAGRLAWLRPLAAVGTAAAVGIGALAGYQALSGDSSAPVANPPAASEDSPASLDDLKNRVAIQNTGRDYTRSGLRTEAAALKNPPASATKAAQEGAQDVTKLSSAQGVISCMKQILGNDVPDSISADLGRFEGKPAVIVVVTEGDKSKAWVVSRDCEAGDDKIAGPTTVV